MQRLDRRRFVHNLTATMAAWGMSASTRASADAREPSPEEDSMVPEQRMKQQDDREAPPFKALQEGDRVTIAGPAEQVIEKAYQLGHDLEERRGGCARCTVAALQKALDFVPEAGGLFRAASVLDGGATPHGVQNCGAFTGAGMVIGWACGTEQFHRPQLARKLIRQVYQQFQEQYGTVLCKDVRSKANRDCPKVVGLGAQWTAEALLAQFANDDKKGL